MTFVLGDAASTPHEVLRAAVGQLDVWWFGFNHRMQGLTDDEFWWEPAPNSYSLIERDGQWYASWPPGSRGEVVPPVTTIAWRMAHVSLGCFFDRWHTYFDSDAGDFTNQPFPGNAADAWAHMAGWFQTWQDALRTIGDDGMWRKLGDSQGNVSVMQMGVDDPFINLVLHINREVMHHGAEICLLRDLYRAQRGSS